MDPITLEGEPNPSGADGIIRAGGDNQLIGDSLLLRGKEKDFWVEGVVGVRCDIRHGQGLIGYFCFVGGDGAGKAGHDLIVRIKSK